VSAAANEVGLLVEELMPLLGMLWALARAPATTAKTGGGHRTDAPAPWHATAAPALLDIDAAARRLERELHQEVFGTPAARRGGSYANTRAALEQLTRLAYAVPDSSARRAAREVSGWIRHARWTIGEDERPQPIPRAPGKDPVICPYCDTYALRVVPRDSRIWCINGECTDRDEHRPNGTLGYDDETGEGKIMWADGRVTRHRDLA
jgi:hypothetical protein